MSFAPSPLNFPYAPVKLSGTIKSSPQDFQVIEQLGFEPCGHGEHLFLRIEKTALTTHELIQQLARKTGLKTRDIGYSGLKDKQAVTQQWISLHMPASKNIPQLEDSEDYRVLQVERNDKKLRVGVHRSNAFKIIIRNLKGQSDYLDSAVGDINRYGFANYFGEQRFGSNHDNVEQALRVLTNRHKLKRLTRSKKSIYISALRSELFNQVLSRRLHEHIWKHPLQGDVFMLAGTQSVFNSDVNKDILQRYITHDIHSALSLFGRGESRLRGVAQGLEEEIFNTHGEWLEVLQQLGVKRALRANRGLVKDFKVDFQAGADEMNVSVELSKGCYLTTLLNHFIRV